MNVLEQLRAGKLAGAKRLNLSCGLHTFPPEIFNLADTLEILDLSGNELNALPDELPRLHKLRVLFCSNNQFTRLPEVLGDCQQLSMVGFKANRIRHVPAASLPHALRWLILTDNQIETLPVELGNCQQLQKLMLAGNRLQALPQTLVSCVQLELLRIAANQFLEIPEWLFKLPRLSWLAYAGNPCTEVLEDLAEQHSPIVQIDWEHLHLERKLGEGASGIIHHAQWQTTPSRQVAVKLFKGTLTSDGLPHSEMASCISAGAHPNLISVLGKIHRHPDSALGLVMPLIDPAFANLAGPPSLESCTRDIYPANTTFSINTLLRLALGIAAAAEHLHARGILHGDLYAHNILHDGQGNALLGDFGAASFYEVKQAERALALQRIEVRAFGCLLEELLDRCKESTCARSELEQLREITTHFSSTKRPLFCEIRQRLMALASESQ